MSALGVGPGQAVPKGAQKGAQKGVGHLFRAPPYWSKVRLA
jgi:hypothetical protein